MVPDTERRSGSSYESSITKSFDLSSQVSAHEKNPRAKQNKTKQSTLVYQTNNLHGPRSEIALLPDIQKGCP